MPPRRLPRPRTLGAATLSVAAALVLAACASGSGESSDATTAESTRSEPAAAPTPTVALQTLDARPVAVAEGLESPLLAVSPPGDPRLFAVEQSGRVWRIDGGRRQLYLDLSDRISVGGERGLLGLAFHPRFARNGRLFVNYTDTSGDTRVVEFTADPGAARVDRGTARELLSASQPVESHNGGHVLFGPDGLLYLGLGDGGGGGDPEANGQNPRTLLGTILRIDVDGRAGARPYAIPPDNPFADGAGGAPEVYAYGLRNPWRFDFDPATGDLWIADVGQDGPEEVSVLRAGDPPGANLGWKALEGTRRHDDDTPVPEPRVDPVAEYDHGSGCSVTGGVVYRGDDLPALAGRYVYGDFCTGRIWTLAARGDPGEPVEITDLIGGPVPSLRSFGTDADGELYLAAQEAVFRLAPG